MRRGQPLPTSTTTGGIAATGGATGDGSLLGRLLQDDLARLHVNPAVQRDEQQRGDVKRAQRGVQGVEDVVRVDAAAGHLLHLHVLRRLLHPPPEERRQGDGDGDHPRRGHHGGGARRRAPLGVLHGVRDGPVAVQRDDAQVEDGGGAARDVRGEPQVAYRLAQGPGVRHRVQHADGHHQDGHQQVGGGQRRDQEVGGRAQLARPRDHRHHEGVGQRGHQGDGGQDRRQGDLVDQTRRRVRADGLVGGGGGGGGGSCAVGGGSDHDGGLDRTGSLHPPPPSCLLSCRTSLAQESGSSHSYPTPKAQGFGFFLYLAGRAI